MAAEITGSGSGSGSSSGVSKVTFEIDWHESGTSIGDSSRGDGESGKITANWTTREVTLIHDLGTKYLAVDVLDIDGEIAGTANQWLDTGVTAEVTIRYISDSTILLDFGTSATADARFHVNIIG
tara:strand:+ start:122 stop:496 length:375 start_codon:yes stop_codon:yes gene_type:complete